MGSETIFRSKEFFLKKGTPGSAHEIPGDVRSDKSTVKDGKRRCHCFAQENGGRDHLQNYLSFNNLCSHLSMLTYNPPRQHYSHSADHCSGSLNECRKRSQTGVTASDCGPQRLFPGVVW